MDTTKTKSKPIPTRFDDPETEFIKLVSQSTGLPQSEIVRRGVRALRLKAADHSNFGFLLEIAS